MKSAVIIFLCCAVQAFGQDAAPAFPADTASLRFMPGDTSLRLPHTIVLRGSVHLFQDAAELPPNAFTIDWSTGRIALRDSSLLPADSAHPRVLRVTYAYLPVEFPQSFYHRQLVLQDDTVGTRSLHVKTKSPPLTVDNIFGPGFQKSGTLIRGVSAGNRQDVLLNSGFQLQFSGRVAGDVDVSGSLTDNNSPIQPEGNTQTLQELDKVYVTFRAPAVGGTLGDFVETMGGTDLANVTRKVQGGEVGARAEDVDGRFVAATTRGKYKTVTMQGLDGVQGPYRLTGENGENGIIVVAGTEHVFVDGIAQTRGENLDYIIDYSTAEVTFSPRRLITSASRIVIDYQYSDRKFARSLIAGQATVRFADSAVRLTTTYLREADNQDAPLDITVSDSDRALLAQAGGDQSKATRSGVRDAGVDSVTGRGKGLYVQRDTIINGVQDTFYLYAPGDSLARYSVTFSYVGAGNGTYSRVAGQEYRFVGVRGGDYVPVVYLAMQQMTQVIDERITATIASGVAATAELALSDVSLNRFSTLSDAHRTGTAGTLALQVAPQRLGAIGAVEGSVRVRSLAPQFRAIDRIDDIEFARQWNLPQSATEVKQNLIEGRATYSPVENTHVGAELGQVQVGDAYATLRQAYTLTSSSIANSALTYRAEILHSTGAAAVTSSQWTRQTGDARYTIGAFTPGVHVETEQREDLAHAIDSTGAHPDTLSPLSFRYLQWGPRVQIAAARGLALFGEWATRTDDSSRANTLQRQSRSTIYRAGFDMQNVAGITSSAEFGVRNKTVDPLFAGGDQSSQSVLFRLQGSTRPLHGAIAADVFYSTATQRASKLERVFVLVPYGTGQYKYLGDLNNNGVQDESEFTLTNANDGSYTVIYRPTDQLYPIIDLKTSARVRLAPSLALGPKPQGLDALLAALSSETSVRIEERNTTQTLSDIYLLRLSHFLDENLTMAGAQQLQQDFFLLENDPEFNLRARYSQRRSLTELATIGERAYQREQSMRVRWHMITEFAAEFTGALLRDQLAATGSTVNTPRQLGTTQFTSDLSYRPIPEIEVGWKADVRTTTDEIVAPAVVADKNFQTIRTSYSFTGFGRVQGELERDQVSLSALPQGYTSSFQLTDGFAAGTTYIARVIFDYRVTANVQATANYTGRLHDGVLPIHTFQAEVRAMF